MMLAVCFAAIACEKDEPENGASNKEEYAGQMTQTMMGNATSVDASVFVTFVDDNTATITLPASGEEGAQMYVPSIDIKNVKLEGARGNQTINMDPFKVPTAAMDLDFQKGMTGSIKNGTLELAFEMKPGKMPFAIPHTFSGQLVK